MSARNNKSPFDEFVEKETVDVSKLRLPDMGVDAQSNVATGFSDRLKPASRKDLEQFRSASPTGSSGWKLRRT